MAKLRSWKIAVVYIFSLQCHVADVHLSGTCAGTARLAMYNSFPSFLYKYRNSETFLEQLLHSAGKFKCLLEGNPIDIDGPTPPSSFRIEAVRKSQIVRQVKWRVSANNNSILIGSILVHVLTDIASTNHVTLSVLCGDSRFVEHMAMGDGGLHFAV